MVAFYAKRAHLSIIVATVQYCGPRKETGICDTPDIRVTG